MPVSRVNKRLRKPQPSLLYLHSHSLAAFCFQLRAGVVSRLDLSDGEAQNSPADFCLWESCFNRCVEIGHYQNEWEPGPQSMLQRCLGCFGGTGFSRAAKSCIRAILLCTVPGCTNSHNFVVMWHYSDCFSLLSCPSKPFQVPSRY